MDYKKILTLLECGNDVMIFPCGFTSIILNNGIKGKRNPLGKELEAAGLFDYSDYHKHYYHWVGRFNQSVTHKECFAEHMAKILTEKIGVNFNYNSKLD